MPPIAIAAGIAAAGSIGGAALAHHGASQQADAALQSSQEANALQRYMYNQNRADLAPYRQAGYGALNQLTQLTGPNGALMHDFTTKDFQTDPGYKFRLAEGQKALDRSAAARGNLFSGATLKANDQYNQNFASNEFQNAYNRFNQNRSQKFNYLASLAGIGQTAVGQGVQNATETANQIGQNTIAGATGAANARASGYAAIGNAINGGATNLLSLYLANRQGAL